jgi:hypothetical protein
MLVNSLNHVWRKHLAVVRVKPEADFKDIDILVIGHGNLIFVDSLVVVSNCFIGVVLPCYVVCRSRIRNHHLTLTVIKWIGMYPL